MASVMIASLLGPLPAEIPDLLSNALARNPSLTLLEPEAHFPGDYDVAQLKQWHVWPPWREADLDRDGRADVVAAVAQRIGDKLTFGVMAVHSSAPGLIHWVDAPHDDTLYSVAIGPAPDTVVPLHCIECDANAWFRWSGRAYQVELYAPSELIAVATHENVQLGLFRKPLRSSGMVVAVPPCTPARVLRVRGETYEDRWYFVEVVKAGTRGWIPATFAAESECIG